MGRFVGVIFLDRRIQVTIRVPALNAQGGGRAPPHILPRNITALGRKAAALQHRFSMKARPGVAGGHHLDDPAQSPAVFGRVVAGEHIYRLEFFDFQRRGKSGGAVVGDRETVDDILRVVLGAPWVQHAVGFEQPARLGLHQFQHSAGRMRGSPVTQGFRAEVVDGAGAMRVQQGGRVSDQHGGFQGGDPERHLVVQGKFGADFQQD